MPFKGRRSPVSALKTLLSHSACGYAAKGNELDEYMHLSKMFPSNPCTPHLHQVLYDFTRREHVHYNETLVHMVPWLFSLQLLYFPHGDSFDVLSVCFRCQPMLSKLYFVWVIPSGNDFEVSCVVVVNRVYSHDGWLASLRASRLTGERKHYVNML